MWKNLSHPNVLNLIGVLDTLEDGMFSTISEWMAHGNVMEYVTSHAGNHLKLVGQNPTSLCHLLSTYQLADAIEGLQYLHNTNIVHGDLKGVSLSIRIPRAPLILFRTIS
jgi:serine/threonine protein kinase